MIGGAPKPGDSWPPGAAHIGAEAATDIVLTGRPEVKAPAIASGTRIAMEIVIPHRARPVRLIDAALRIVRSTRVFSGELRGDGHLSPENTADISPAAIVEAVAVT